MKIQVYEKKIALLFNHVREENDEGGTLKKGQEKVKEKDTRIYILFINGFTSKELGKIWMGRVIFKGVSGQDGEGGWCYNL